MRRTLLLLLIGCWMVRAPLTFGQGALTPPGAPAPTMKTLQQVEPRTPISTATTITQPGAYYLTTNITVAAGNAITIAADNVTLDLNGFTLASTAATPAGYGIDLGSGRRQITILNGHITGGVTFNGSIYTGPGFLVGIGFSGSLPANIRVSGVTVAGCLNHGILLSTTVGTVVESCTVRDIGGTGIWADSVSRSTAVQCGGGIVARAATDCYAQSTGFNVAIYAEVVSHCYGESSGNSIGINATTASHCYGYSPDNDGVRATTASNCYGVSLTGGYGVNAISADNCYGYSGSASGIEANVATNCRGYSNTGNGVSATTANNCYGESVGDFPALTAYRLAIGCYGYNSSNGIGVAIGNGIAVGCYGYSVSSTGLYAYIANSCRGESFSGTPQSITHKYNMP